MTFIRGGIRELAIVDDTNVDPITFDSDGDAIMFDSSGDVEMAPY